MRVLFAGSPPLAVASLESVHRRHSIIAVLTNPDRPAGRRGAPVPTPVKARARELGLRVLQPMRLDADAVEEVRELGCDLLVVVAYGRIFPREFLEVFPRGGVNLHPSLLPRHRGPSPISAAILAGDEETGVSVQRLAPRMDSGDILRVQRVPLTGRETTGFLSEALGRLGAELLAEALADVEVGRDAGHPQAEAEATYCRLVRKEDGRLDWGLGADDLERRIRAYDPWPGAFTTFRGQVLHLLAGGVCPVDAPGAPSDPRQGLVLGTDKRYGILVQTGRGILYADRLQLQSKKPADWRAFLNGQRDFVGSLLGVNDD